MRELEIWVADAWELEVHVADVQELEARWRTWERSVSLRVHQKR